jgi:hypothetical protein
MATGSVNIGGGRGIQSTAAAVAQRAVAVVRFVENWKSKYRGEIELKVLVTGQWLKTRLAQRIPSKSEPMPAPSQRPPLALREIALLEAAKGLLALAAACGDGCVPAPARICGTRLRGGDDAGEVNFSDGVIGSR